MATKKVTKKSTKTAAQTKETAKKKTTSRAASKKVVKTAPKTTVKASTKTTPKTTVKSVAAVEKTTPEKTYTSTTDDRKTVQVRKKYVGLIALILLTGALLYFFRGLFVAAVVNGQPISRLEVVKQAEKQSGKQTLDTLVRNALIEQKAKQENVTVSDQEVNDEIKKLEDNLSKQGQKLDQVLEAQAMTRDELTKLIRLDKLVAKMVGKDIKVSDQEVNEYLEKNKDALPEGTDENTLKKQIAEQLKQQKTNEKVRNWLADLQKEAAIKYYVQY